MIAGARLVVLGRQGAGKGTQCVRLARHYVVPHISTGDMLRQAVRDRTEAGLRAADFMSAGELVPDDVIIGVVEERLDSDDTVHRGFVLDGFPRNVAQAEELDRFAGPDGVELCIDIEVPTDIVLARLAGRRVCTDCGTNYSPDNHPEVDGVCDVCGGRVIQREDDTESAIKRRLELYEQATAPLVDWYRATDRLVVVDGIGPLDEVTARLVAAVDAVRKT